MFPISLLDRAEALLSRCNDRGLRISTAESCTGGLIAGLLTSVPGSSAVVERGFVTYTNEAKTELLGVPAELFETVGAVSEEVAVAMASGALENSAADLAVAVTGIAGPGGATPGKPVGLVHLAAARESGVQLSRRDVFDGDRQAVRLAAVETALAMLDELLG